MIEPGGSRKFRLRVLAYFAVDPVRNRQLVPLAFEQPGEATVTVRCPLIFEGADHSEWFQSEPIRLRIKAPAGDEAAVWQAIRDDETLAFLENHWLPGRPAMRRKEVAWKLVRLLKDHPLSRYGPALRYALRGYYHNNMTRLTPAEAQEMRDLLGVVDSVDALFPGDRRLDAEVLIDFPKPTPLRDVLRSYSKQVRVPLAASDTIEGTVQLRRHANPLRLEMLRLSQAHRASWRRRGDGYYLAPDDELPPPRKP
ncbi:MAG TPA: hypothetical protein VG406_03165 [Isosphaeraceae bacterium]|nr:hypothetical protein [Isosphaeraceae bacterium]